MLFCCLWRNVEISCYKHFVVDSNKLRRLLPAMSQLATVRRHRVVNTKPVAGLTARDEARYYSRKSRFLPIPPAFNAPVRGVPRRNIAMAFGTQNYNGVAT